MVIWRSVVSGMVGLPFFPT